jgi:hypothetical protein
MILFIVDIPCNFNDESIEAFPLLANPQSVRNSPDAF